MAILRIHPRSEYGSFSLWACVVCCWAWPSSLAAGAPTASTRAVRSRSTAVSAGVFANSGPMTWEIAADRETVFEVIASPYLGKTPRSISDHLDVWESGSDMVLAAHSTKVKCGVTTTVETVHFERPDRINFRLVRGPVPHVRESFVLEEAEKGSTLTWVGELGTDYGALGALWGDVVARSWEKTVRCHGGNHQRGRAPVPPRRVSALSLPRRARLQASLCATSASDEVVAELGWLQSGVGI